MNDLTLGNTPKCRSKMNQTALGLMATSGERRKVVASLEAMVKQSNAKRIEAETSLSQYRHAMIYKENQYKRLIAKYDPKVAMSVAGNHNIESTYSKIFQNFQAYNAEAQSMLEIKFNEIYQLMERRVGQVVDKMETEVASTKKISEKNFSSMRNEIKEVVRLAKEIQDENTKLRKSNETLRFKLKVTTEEKGLLLSELYKKRVIISKLTKEKTQRGTAHSLLDSPQITKDSDFNTIRFLGEPAFASSPEHRSLIHSSRSRHETPNSRNPQNIKSVQSTIAHLKNCLERERKRRIELSNVVHTLQERNVKVNEAIEKCLAGQIPIIGALDGDRLLQLLKDIKIRLASTEKPAANCGWRDFEFMDSV